MFLRNKSLTLVIYCGNIPNSRDITNTYTTLPQWIYSMSGGHFGPGGLDIIMVSIGKGRYMQGSTGLRHRMEDSWEYI